MLNTTLLYRNVTLALNLSSSILRKVSILLANGRKGMPFVSWEICKARRYMFGGKIAYLPYTKKYGEVLRKGLGVTWSAHNAFTKALCQFLCSEKTIFLIMKMIFLFVDSIKPFPYG